MLAQGALFGRNKLTVGKGIEFSGPSIATHV
jgi:hypothetical protein